MAEVALREVTKRFGAVTALDRLDLEVADGEVVAVLGPSGAGKSTVLSLVAGFEAPTAGSVHLGGRDVSGVPAHRRDVGLVLQSYALFPHLCVLDNVAFPLRARGVRRDMRRARALEALEVVGLGGFERRRPHELSGGQQQRVALARAIVFEPKVLLLDEPLAALDRRLRQQVQLELRALQRRLGTTTVVVTHDQEEAMTMADRVVVLHEGRVAQCGTPQELYQRPADPFVATFLGDGALLAGRTSTNGRGPVLALEGGDAVHLDPQRAPQPGRSALVLVRPEHVRLTAAPPADGAAVRVHVRDAVFAGAHTSYRLELPGGQRLSATSAPGEPAFAIGAHAYAAWDPTSAHVLDPESSPQEITP